MSVPVLSRLLIAMLSRLLRRDPAAGFDTHRLQTKQFHSTTRRQSTSRLPNSAVRPHARYFTHLAQHHPTLRANPYPEVTDLFCRLPLPTLFYQLEAFHLGDLLRLSVRPDARINVTSDLFPSDFQGPSEAHRTLWKW